MSDEQETKMTAFMIYTAGDTSGSLGGLVRRQPLILNPSKSALIRSRWCSYDPICCTSYKANLKTMLLVYLALLFLKPLMNVEIWL